MNGGRERTPGIPGRGDNQIRAARLGVIREEAMRKKCEDCGVWAEEEYILDMDGVELCVLCALQLEECDGARETGGITE